MTMIKFNYWEELLSILKWSNPILWPECGKAEPPEQLKRDGFLAFADGVNWDPGAGRGFYVWNATSEQWEKIGTTEKVSDSKFNIFQLDGDLWIVANAYYDFDDSEWNRIDTSKYAFALQLQGTNFIPGESVQGVNLWRAVPGTNPIGDFGTYGGWEAVQLWTGYGDTVVGGYSIELDGHGTLPYGRFIHTTVGGDEYTGILTNLFGDMSGKDVSSESSWFIGRKNDEFVIARMPSGSSSFSIPFRVDSSGRYFFMPATDEPATNDMVDGELTFFLDLNAGVLKGKYRYDSTTVYVFNIASLT